MSKSSGLADAAFVGGYDLSSGVLSLSKVGGGCAVDDVTPINKLAHARIPLGRDGYIDFETAFDPAVGQSHPVLSVLPRTDIQVMYCRGTSIGSDAACEIAKQIDYAPTRAANGSLRVAVSTLPNGFGMEWANQLTPGLYTASNLLAGNASTFEGGIANWAGVTNCAVAQSSAQAHSGTKSLAVTSTAGGDMVAESCAAGSILTQGFAVVPGQQVQVQGWLRTAVSARTCSIGVHWYTSGAASVSTTYGTGAADSAGAWTIESGTLTAPATAAWASVSVKVAATGAGSEVHYLDDVQLLILPASYDSGGSLSFGAQAYLQVTGFTGTDATVKIQDSADNVTFADVASFAFAQTTVANTTQRIALGNTATVRRYVAATVTTVGGFTALSFVCAMAKNPVAGQVF